MRCQLLRRHNVRDLNSSNELETLRAMPFKINRWATSTLFGFYSTGVARKQMSRGWTNTETSPGRINDCFLIR